MNHYNLNLLGFKLKLPIIKIGPKLSIASFSILGNTELIDVIAQELVSRIKFFDFDILIGSETKTLPLVYQMSQILGHKKYVITRKKIKGYMNNPVKIGKEGLILNGPDAKLLKGKKVILVTDVVATGKTANNIERLLEKVGADLVAVACVLKQEKVKEEITKPLFYLASIPLLKPDKDQ